MAVKKEKASGRYFRAAVPKYSEGYKGKIQDCNILNQG